MEWIKCEDELPETKPEHNYHVSEEVVVLIGDNDLQIARYNHSGEDDDPWSSWYCEAYEDNVENVRAWCKIPKLPCE